MASSTSSCVIFALAHEAREFLRFCSTIHKLDSAPCWAARCQHGQQQILVLQTGIGPHAMRRALTWLEAQGPALVVSGGFAGALDESLQTGDVILASEVIDATGQVWRTTWPDPRKGQNEGRLLTMPRLIGNVQKKKELGRLFQALAVDMESAQVADFCTSRGIPFACLRAISDDVNTPLSPGLVDLLAGGRVSWWKLLANVARKPTLIGECYRLLKNSRKASLALGQALRVHL